MAESGLTMGEDDFDGEQLVTSGYVLAKLAASRTTLHRLIKAKQWPAPLKFAGGRINRWRLADVDAALRALHQQRAIRPEVRAVPPLPLLVKPTPPKLKPSRKARRGSSGASA